MNRNLVIGGSFRQVKRWIIWIRGESAASPICPIIVAGALDFTIVECRRLGTDPMVIITLLLLRLVDSMSQGTHFGLSLDRFP